MIKRLLAGFSLLALWLSACYGVGVHPPRPINASGETHRRLTVFSAASLSEAFTEIGARFEAQHPGVQVVFNYAGSQQLAHQLAQGAPADVFASANQRQMQAAFQAGRVDAGSVRAFAYNRLVVIHPGDNPARIRDLQDLARPGLKLALADSAAPVGYYSMQFLEKASQPAGLGADYKGDVLGNVVSYETNVRAVLGKVVLGEVDGGVVYASDISPANVGQLGRLDIPDALNVVASYYIAPIGDSAQLDLAAVFLDFVLSAPGQEILVRHSLTPLTPGVMEATN